MTIYARIYNTSINVAPATLTPGTVYGALNNPSASGIALKLLEARAQSSFAAAAANTRSFFVLQKASVLATGGSTITPTHVVDPIANSSAEVRFSTTGLAITPGSSDQFFFFAQPSQPSSIGMPPPLTFTDDNPFVVAPGSSLIAAAFTVTAISGVAVSLYLKWAEE